MRKRLTIVGVLAALALGVAFFDRTPTASAGAAQLFITQSCSNGKVTATFTWNGNNPTAIQQWVDLSLFNNGWAGGTFLGSGPWRASVQSIYWPGLLPGQTHYVRIHQLLPNGTWDASATFYFTTESCPVPRLVPAQQSTTSVYDDILSRINLDGLRSTYQPAPDPYGLDYSYDTGGGSSGGSSSGGGGGDYDCAGGPGDGPYYVDGPVYVGPDDPYGLDGDGDGIGCE